MGSREKDKGHRQQSWHQDLSRLVSKIYIQLKRDVFLHLLQTFLLTFGIFSCSPTLNIDKKCQQQGENFQIHYFPVERSTQNDIQWFDSLGLCVIIDIESSSDYVRNFIVYQLTEIDLLYGNNFELFSFCDWKCKNQKWVAFFSNY